MFASPVLKSGYSGSSSTEGPDKVDMSLDDIIRLNKKQKQLQNQQAGFRKQKMVFRGRLAQGKRVGGRPGATPHRGGGMNKLFSRGRKVPAHRGQRVVTGLAARKTALLKGISPLNRPAVQTRPPPKKRPPNRPGLNRTALTQRGRPFVLRREPQHGSTQRWTYTPTDAQKTPAQVTRRPFRLHRKWNAPPSVPSQREARQATFLSRRGLKIHAHVQKSTPAPATQRTRPWRTPLPSNGILKVSIDNPTARTQPEPAHSWSLHPASAPPPALLSAEKEPERKPPKGVPLQFDINSVGKQTSMTLNERFRILKDKRVAAAQQSSKGGRFVTVG